MSNNRAITWSAALLVIACLSGSVLVLRQVDHLRGKQATLEEVLYLRSGKTLKRLSLGYSGLLADVYWTRAVQYFGGRHVEGAVRYDLLYPLLDITTDLDPNLIIAYEAGSVFLSQKAPTGAGQPEKAAALVEKGIRANPSYWRLYFTLGFIHYMDRNDYKAAYEAFDKGSQVPGALSWMKTMAATMAQHAGESGAAFALWSRLAESTENDLVRKNALQHIAALRVDQDVEELERRVEAYRQQAGRLPSSWIDLIRAGLLEGIPADPNREPYRLMPDGSVQVHDPDSLPFISKGLPPRK